jgi:hypothetical protein
MSDTNKNNSGNRNSGSYNSGNRNSGSYNSGYRNSGSYNSGSYNSGSINSGSYNSGSINSGSINSGSYNSGNRNSGDRNSGQYNSGNRNSGFFNTDEPTVRMFNKDTGLKIGLINIPFIDLKINEWINEDEMTDEQKLADKDFHIKGGALIKRDYKEAWALYWSEASKENKDRFLNLPNFCPEIFKEITGIDVNKKGCAGKIVEIDGKKYELKELNE